MELRVTDNDLLVPLVIFVKNGLSATLLIAHLFQLTSRIPKLSTREQRLQGESWTSGGFG